MTKVTVLLLLTLLFYVIVYDVTNITILIVKFYFGLV